MKNTPLTSAEMHAELSPQRERELRALIVENCIPTKYHEGITRQRERELRARRVENCLLVMQLHCLTGIAILTLADKWHRARALANYDMRRP